MRPVDATSRDKCCSLRSLLDFCSTRLSGRYSRPPQRNGERERFALAHGVGLASRRGSVWTRIRLSAHGSRTRAVACACEACVRARMRVRVR
eukprot:6197848-Pleurochrysis_carterae.AAC.1